MLIFAVKSSFLPNLVNFMTGYKYCFIVFLFLFNFSSPISAFDIKDEEINQDGINKYTLVNVEKAKAIMQLMRERRMFPTYKLNRIEGSIYFNRADYIEALRLYKRALFDQEIEKVIPEKLAIYNMIMLCYYYLHDIPSTEYYVEKLYDLATKSDNKLYLSSAYFGKGLVDHAKNNKATAYSHFEECISLLKEIDTPCSRDKLFYRYLSLLEHQQEDNLNEEALQTIQIIYDFQASRDSSETYMDPWDSVHKKDYLAHCAVIHQRLGHTELAADYYQQLINTANMYQSDYKCIEPYLYDMKLYDDIIRFTNARKYYLKSIADTMNYEMISISEMSARAHIAKGDYEKASSDYAKILLYYEKIKQSEENSIMTELTSNYEMKEKELTTERQTTRTKIKNILFVTFLLFMMAAFIVYRTIHYNRIITRKNQILTKRIDELLSFKEDLFKENNQKKEEPNELEKELFDHMHQCIVKDQLYLDPELSREVLMKRFCIPRNVFSSLFHKYMNTSYNQYINDFRLEYAIKLFKDYPNYTIDAIANESGFYSPTSLYRLFSQKYGMTPSEYRTMLIESSQQEKQNLPVPPKDCQTSCG